MKRVSTNLSDKTTMKLENFCKNQDGMSKSAGISFLVEKALEIFHPDESSHLLEDAYRKVGNR